MLRATFIINLDYKKSTGMSYFQHWRIFKILVSVYITYDLNGVNILLIFLMPTNFKIINIFLQNQVEPRKGKHVCSHGAFVPTILAQS